MFILVPLQADHQPRHLEAVNFKGTVVKAGRVIRLTVTTRCQCVVRYFYIRGDSQLCGPAPADLFAPFAAPSLAQFPVVPGDEIVAQIENVHVWPWWKRALGWVARKTGWRIIAEWDRRLSPAIAACAIVECWPEVEA